MKTAQKSISKLMNYNGVYVFVYNLVNFLLKHPHSSKFMCVIYFGYSYQSASGIKQSSI